MHCTKLLGSKTGKILNLGFRTFNISSAGTLQYGGIGGKIVISDYINEMFASGPTYAKKLNVLSYPKIFSLNTKHPIEAATKTPKAFWNEVVSETL